MNAAKHLSSLFPTVLLSLVPAAADPLPRSVLHGLYTVRVRPGSRLLDVGQQCRLCLLDFVLGQRVRTLPCRHKVKPRR